MSDDKKRSDSELVRACLEGDESSQRYLYTKYYGLMMGICLRYASDRMEAQDMVQEGFIKIFKALPKFENQGSFEGWMKRIMINNAIDQYRKEARKPYHDDLDNAYQLGHNEVVSGELGKQELLALIQRLPKGYRTIFNMYAIEGYNHQEIAAELGISEGTSKSQLSKARKHLQKMLEAIRKTENEGQE